jgi:hypothetical protein
MKELPPFVTLDENEGITSLDENEGITSLKGIASLKELPPFVTLTHLSNTKQHAETNPPHQILLHRLLKPWLWMGRQ